MKRPSELRDAFTERAAGFVDAKYGMLVAVECDWLAVLE
jgi:hypothetical protein